MLDIQYKIIGGDNAEYGPASLAELKGWIRDGRVAAMTKVWRSDLDLWSHADRYTELHEELARLHIAAEAAAGRALAPAGFWPRGAAWLIDRFILAVLALMLWSMVADSHHWQMPVVPVNPTAAEFEHYQTAAMEWGMQQFAPLFFPIFLVYDVLLNGRFGATLGKMAVGVRITKLNGAPMGYNRALVRWLAARLTDMSFGIGYLPAFVRPDKRALHDLLAGTKVVYNR